MVSSARTRRSTKATSVGADIGAYGGEERVTFGEPTTVADPTKPVAVTSVLGGLHVDYRTAA